MDTSLLVHKLTLIISAHSLHIVIETGIMSYELIP